LDLPENCVLVKIIRNREIILPRGNTHLHVGDIVEIFGMKDKLAEAEKHLSSQNPKSIEKILLELK